jgi:hypothetical protein
MIPVSRLAALAALLLVITSAPARAEGFLTPFIGENFGGDSASCAGQTDCRPKRTTYGVSVGAMGPSVGFEEDLGFAKNFFGAAPGTENSVFSAMSNLLFFGASSRTQLYTVSGVGLVRANVSLNHTSVHSSGLGYDLGGGVNGIVRKHVAIRLDIRHFKTFKDINVPLFNEKLSFWRASVGLTLKF